MTLQFNNKYRLTPILALDKDQEEEMILQKRLSEILKSKLDSATRKVLYENLLQHFNNFKQDQKIKSLPPALSVPPTTVLESLPSPLRKRSKHTVKKTKVSLTESAEKAHGDVSEPLSAPEPVLPMTPVKQKPPARRGRRTPFQRSPYPIRSKSQIGSGRLYIVRWSNL